MMMLVQAQPGRDRGDEDESLIAAAAQGDRGAFGELYSRYARMVHGILLARVPAGDAEDLVQDVFMCAMRQLRVLRTAAAFRGWLAAIARNRAIDYFRASKQRADFDERTLREHGVAADQEGFEILELIAQGMSNREIAEKLFVSENTVKTHSSRLLDKLSAKRRTQAVQIAKELGLIP